MEKTSKIILCSLTTFSALLYGGALYKYILGFDFSEMQVLFYICYAIIVLPIFILGLYTKFKKENYNRKDGESIYERYLIDELKREIKKLEEKLSENQEQVEESKTNILLLMLKNSKETTEYFRISKSHSKSAHIFSIISCIFGFILLSFAILSYIVTNKIEISVIGTISGALTEIIAGTVLVINNKSAAQLNHYYDALHQNEKFLSAVNLADKLSPESKEEIYIEIIRKQIEMDEQSK